MALVTKSMVKQDKQDLQVSDWQITVKHQKKRSAKGLKKIFRPGVRDIGVRVTVIHLALAIGFAISGHVIKSYRV